MTRKRAQLFRHPFLFVASTLLCAACSDSEPGPRGEAPDSGETPSDAGRRSEEEAGSRRDAAQMGSLGQPLAFTGSFTQGDVIPPRHVCASPFGGGAGDNISPPLEWRGGPTETKSFGLVLYDVTYDMLHWVVWDIPATATALPEGIPAGFDLSEPAGAHQVSPAGHEYFGPCSSGSIAGTYEYRLYALALETLTLDESSSAAEAEEAVRGTALGFAFWAGSPE